MNIALVCFARNEADVLETHVRHHAMFADSLHYVLHRTRDNSAEILNALRKEGLPVSFTTNDALLHIQATVMTALMQEGATNGADWILPLDADEFLTGDVQSVLTEADRTKPLKVDWRIYVPTESDPGNERNVLRRITQRRICEIPQWSKVLVPGTLAKNRDVTLGFGNHELLKKNAVKTPNPTALCALAHFPIRSAQQFRRKVYGGWISHLADPARKPGSSFQWESAYHKFLNSEDISASQLETFARSYASPESVAIVPDPVPTDIDIRYEIREVTPISVLMETSECLAMDYARIAKLITKQSGNEVL